MTQTSGEADLVATTRSCFSDGNNTTTTTTTVHMLSHFFEPNHSTMGFFI